MPDALLFPDANTPPEGPKPVAYAQVIFNRPLTTVFTYGIPAELQAEVVPGKRLIVPLGRGNAQAIGYCVDVSDTPPDRKTKMITRVIDSDPLFTPQLLKLTQWLAEYYFCGWGQALDAVIPAAAKAQAGSRERDFITAIPDPLIPIAPPRLSKKQAVALEYLRTHPGTHEARYVVEQTGCSLAVLWGLVERGYATREKRRVENHLIPARAMPTQQPMVLNSDQEKAHQAIVKQIDAGGYHCFLLYGVTGSGKTEVYLQAIDRVVRAGKQALVMVPEISLTPQAIQRFEARFGEVAVLHSHLTDADRGSHWRRIAMGNVPVIVGARSAVFAPTANLGLIIVDEEHEQSFKQEATPRYHGRDLAIVRAHREGIPIVLGSATPSLESWNNAKKGTYTQLDLPERVSGRPLPPVGVIDMRHEKIPPGPYKAIGPSLEAAIQQSLAAGGQVILLLNRRGFDTCLFCPDCGMTVKCKFCDVAMTYHRHGRPRTREGEAPAEPSATTFHHPPPRTAHGYRGEQRDMSGSVICHYCGYETAPPKRCTTCGVGSLRYYGLGTEKLEEELAVKFPGVNAARMDADATKKTGSHAKIFKAFQSGEIRILFGTQMIAKGLDVPTVTLVGVVYADQALHLPDFRAAERTFQLLAQVAGRAGRGDHGGKVLVQTFHPDHPCIRLAVKHDYRTFAEAELVGRAVHHFPPSARLARLVFRSRDAVRVEKEAERWGQLMQQEIPRGLKLLGPAEAPLKKLEGWYRYHALVLAGSSTTLHNALKSVQSKYEPAEGVEVTIDVDPVGMM
ncbi:MAG: primosomal protein N' [Gemmatales bacterium]